MNTDFYEIMTFFSMSAVVVVIWLAFAMKGRTRHKPLSEMTHAELQTFFGLMIKVMRLSPKDLFEVAQIFGVYENEWEQEIGVRGCSLCGFIMLDWEKTDPTTEEQKNHPDPEEDENYSFYETECIKCGTEQRAYLQENM